MFFKKIQPLFSINSIIFHRKTQDSLVDKDGNEFKLEPPTGDQLPPNGYDAGRETFQVFF